MNQSILPLPGEIAHGGAFPSIEAIIPHRGTMLLLDSVAACSDESLTADASVRADAWYADAQGAMPAWIGIELMAQAIAAHVGLLSMREGKPVRSGVLLGTRRYAALCPAFASGAPLRVTVKELLRSEEGHGAYDCTIEQDGALCAEATVKVYQPRDFQTFIKESYGS
ncbi:hotdog family protein [Paraburkholderia dinghuensis]|uniref:Beta-hydroxyacyl-ACP dehydratase n=1 Tax=Paraburkholderia dinghuensis TaxID=2305225 RepID=A0A3N6MUX9_9BURK|nr:hotdog family protein [Paraburkholderia dinghuensis]RQH05735.1 beta-hydroxyacyl-ACP dehydratase [Paraburkholderia dinghuensis]